MIPLIIGAALTAAGGIASGIQASNSARKRRLYIAQQQKENENEYNAARKDILESATAQKAITAMDRQNKELIQAVQNPVGGQISREKAIEAVNEQRASTFANIKAQQDQQDQIARQQYLSTKQQLNNALENVNAQADASKVAAWQNVSNIGANLAMSEANKMLSTAGTTTENTTTTVAPALSQKTIDGLNALQTTAKADTSLINDALWKGMYKSFNNRLKYLKLS